jgi:hypothetical protein
METSRSVPQQTAQILSPLAGQNLAGLRFSQIGQDTKSPHAPAAVQQNTPRQGQRQKRQQWPLWYDRWQLRGLLCFAPFAFLDGLAEEVFNLAVDAAQFVLSPGFEFNPELWIDAQ